jgi:hypothetical protein
MEMVQIDLMFREMLTRIKEMLIETQTRLEESVKGSQKEMQANIKEEFKNTREENQRNLERLEYNIMSPEGRLNKDFSLVDQHCRREDAMENRILPLGQESASDSEINDEGTRKNIVEVIIEEENHICIKKIQNEYLNKSQNNAEENRRESEEVTEYIIGKTE